MIFNSFEFLIFLPITFLCYWFVFQGNRRWQNAFLIAASYLFYGWWDWRFLSLIIFSSGLDYFLGQRMEQTTSKKLKKRLMSLSLLANLGLLGVFKYFNFFVDSFVQTFSFFGASIDSWTLNVILPVGISFYTFQTLSYTIDVYRGRLKPTNDPISFFAFVSFFPQLVAGPIERASNLLPQFEKKRTFDHSFAVDGVGQMIWGMFKKVAIADTCAPIVDTIFSDYTSYSSPTLILGVILFSIQIYADFSGYSDIAIGTARLFGFKLLQNFRFPYFSTSIQKFWGKWHISLSTWTNDYIFVPLHSYLYKRNRNAVGISLLCTFLILGMWHGANWTFFIFGLIHGTSVAVEYLNQKNIRKFKLKAGNYMSSILGWIITILIWLLSMIFFRAENITHGYDYLKWIMSFELGNSVPLPKLTLLFIGLLFIIEWFQQSKEHGLSFEKSYLPMIYRWGVYYFFIMIILLFYKDNAATFIYFQF